jgi:UDP-glucose:(heptosyl)LPS alpha-1,3-glucosyltransferase
MRIAITFQRVDPSRGGAETYVADLCRRLVARGHDVSLFASEWDAGALPGEVRIVKVEAKGWTRAGRIWSFARDSEIALKADSHDCSIGFINTWHQDILIPQGGVHQGSLEANAQRFPGTCSRAIYIVFKRLNPKWWGLYRPIERRQYDPARGTRFVAVSHMIAGHLRRFLGVAPDRIRVVPNAIDADRLAVADPAAARAEVRARHGLKDSDLVGLFVAHNARLKGLWPLFKAMASRRDDPRNRPIRLLVCGGKVTRLPICENHVATAGDLRIVGFVASVKDYFHAADFFVLPSYYDPCSLVVFEALACGLPVITTAQNGAGEVITEGQEGIVIPRPDDLRSLRMALDRMTDDAARREMSRRAVELGRAQSFDRHVDRLLELCGEVAASKRASQALTHTPRARGPAGRAERGEPHHPRPKMVGLAAPDLSCDDLRVEEGEAQS